ncbi:MAG: HDOD domain-containing protein [Pseudomonadota bacterium]
MQPQTSQMGRYEVIKTIGRGSQGRVYLARDPKLERDVAIKILTSGKAEFNLTGANGTPLEALTSSKVKHANIVPIYDIGEGSIGPFLVFGFVQGKTLAVHLSNVQKLSPEDAFPMMNIILDAMKTAHDSGVLHLDLSPRNIMLDANGEPQIMDFGLSQFVDFRRTDMTLATGTLRYMAPEHFLRQQLGPFTDVFALASTFYEMLLGERAINGANVEEMQRKIAGVDIDLDKLSTLPGSEEYVKFFNGAFTVDPSDRYADAGEMYKAFQVMVSALGLGDSLRNDASSHSTVDFLIRKMQRKKDFPAISSTLTDINRLTSDENVAPADQLANVILRDMSLTSKLLKMANSGFYGGRASKVTKISQAVVLLGAPQVRLISSSLILFGSMKSDSAVLKDSMTKSFFAGLLARHLCVKEKLKNAEEAFIAGMCHHLGQNLTIYYFPDEHDDIESLRKERGLDSITACQEVLGVTYADLGANVAAIWSLPEIIVDTIRGLPTEGPIAAPTDEAETIRNLSVLCNELCDAFIERELDDITETLSALTARYALSTKISDEYLYKLFAAGYEKLSQFAPVFEINVGSSEFCSAVSAWTTQRGKELAALAEANAESAATATG